MKKIFLITIFVSLCSSVIAQTSLSYQKNAPVKGSSFTTFEFVYVEPGAGGPDQIWDFSNIVFTSKNQTSLTYAQAKEILPDISGFNLVSSEDGYEYYYTVKENKTELLGYAGQGLSLVYTDPVTKMKYPFLYGDKFSDDFSGYGIYNKSASRVDFSGQYTVTADAYGRLILPDRTVKNALRIRIHKTAEENHTCSKIDNDQIIYLWYAEGYRYPIMSIAYKEYQTSYQVHKVEKYGIYSPQGSGDITSVANNSDNDDFTVSAYPNPFDESVSFSYYLNKESSVTIELFDVSGKMSVFLMNDQAQAQGVHTYTIDAVEHGLVPGVYYLRIILGKKVFVQKIVKV